MPFDPHDRDYLMQHFEDHGSDFGATTPEEYEAMADHFMTRCPVDPPLYECTRENGMICRYDSETQEYGARYTWGYIATYFRPIPAGHLPPDERPEFSHEYRTNMQYFRARCE